MGFIPLLVFVPQQKKDGQIFSDRLRKLATVGFAFGLLSCF